MAVQIGQKRESDFSNPLGLLSDCHRRIESFLAVLVRVSEGARGGALNPEQRAALEKALAYFRDAAPKHTADEEESLFPRLSASGEANAILDNLAVLEQDHEIAAQDHQTVDMLGTRWLKGSLSDEDSQALSEALARLNELYTRHIAVEDQMLFPMAARLLEREQMAAMGREMAQRRGIQT